MQLANRKLPTPGLERQTKPHHPLVHHSWHTPITRSDQKRWFLCREVLREKCVNSITLLTAKVECECRAVGSPVVHLRRR
ncbi:hypothetical protein CEXT_147231 [Caerostris extrusa]|uniref:Uncharacterized protein n=1 Tax=Caerostris extrusa TaxID=172846 RepID=A0AAV4T019_CAEEX|nr:hypothetical protein CEXT_147231 [Caerostris extrusa]